MNEIIVMPRLNDEYVREAQKGDVGLEKIMSH